MPTILNGTSMLRVRFIPYNARLVDTRKGEGWTQPELALLTGLSPRSISHIETLKRLPTDDEKQEIADALGRDVAYLFPEPLMETLREGLFKERVAELSEDKLVKLIDRQRRLALPQTEEPDPCPDPTLRHRIEEALETLKPREQRVIKSRFGLNDDEPKTLEEIGKEYGLTGERIRQIEAKALRRLKYPSRSRKLKEYL